MGREQSTGLGTLRCGVKGREEERQEQRGDQWRPSVLNLSRVYVRGGKFGDESTGEGFGMELTGLLLKISIDL